ncbi:MAG: hypothetical protein AB1898_04150 [Acidobacteriota bacterium]
MVRLRLLLPAILLLSFSGIKEVRAGSLPAEYFRLLNQGIERIENRLAAEPQATLPVLESAPGWRHFPSSILVAAVLYTVPHSTNVRYGDERMLKLAIKIGDLLVQEHAAGRYDRLDHHRDTYMWVDAFRLIGPQLDPDRTRRWREVLLTQLGELAADVSERQDYPRYQSPYLVTSPNHYSLWSSTLFLGSLVLDKPEWKALAARVLHRFATEEQSADGFWGEHSFSGPTTGYDYLTSSAVALYYEHSRDSAALAALRRSTDFHIFFTYPDGTPVETINDRNRHWGVSMWGHFGFSHFPDGRRYAELLTSQSLNERFSVEDLGRVAQNALYFHEGPTAPIPQDRFSYQHQMSVPAGIRKQGPWVLCLSGIIDTQTSSRFYLDRQSHLSVFHEKTGLIVTGANSKRQPELATFSGKLDGQIFHLPLSSRLDMSDAGDRLALAYDPFFAVVEVQKPSEQEVGLVFNLRWKRPAAEARLGLQLVLKAGEPIETGSGRKWGLDEKRIELPAEELGGSLRHRGWTLETSPGAQLLWPVHPFNPYANAPENNLSNAVGLLWTPLNREVKSVQLRLSVR